MNAYNIDDDTFNTYEAHINQLACQTQFWPPIKPARVSGNKWATISHLQMIAKKTGRYAPVTTLLHEGHEIPPGVVLKRSHSDCGTHVILPNSNTRHRTWKYLNTVTSKDTFWMAQEYVPSLPKIGEWRVFVVGGKVIAVMHSCKRAGSNGEWKGEQTDAFLTLDEIRFVYAFASSR